MAFHTVTETMTGVVAAADLSAYQYHFVKMTTTGIDICGAAMAHGVLQNKPTALGEPASVVTKGCVKVMAGALVVKGVMVMSDADGHGITATSGNFQQGICRAGSTAAGEYITVEIGSTDYTP